MAKGLLNHLGVVGYLSATFFSGVVVVLFLMAGLYQYLSRSVIAESYRKHRREMWAFLLPVGLTVLLAALQRTVPTHWGERTPDDLIHVSMADIVVHTWDLSRAVDQIPVVDDRLAELGLEALRDLGTHYPIHGTRLLGARPSETRRGRWDSGWASLRSTLASPTHARTARPFRPSSLAWGQRSR